MSKLTDKIEKVRNEIADLQVYLDDLESKHWRQGFKRRRKQHRKRLAKDIIYRMTYEMSKRIEKDLYYGNNQPTATKELY
jgi:hypothetical protein